MGGSGADNTRPWCTALGGSAGAGHGRPKGSSSGCRGTVSAGGVLLCCCPMLAGPSGLSGLLVASFGGALLLSLPSAVAAAGVAVVAPLLRGRGRPRRRRLWLLRLLLQLRMSPTNTGSSWNLAHCWQKRHWRPATWKLGAL